MNKLLLTGFLTAGAAIHNLSAQTTAGQGNQRAFFQRATLRRVGTPLENRLKRSG